jgi:CRP-like cAMP-binding protein
MDPSPVLLATFQKLSVFRDFSPTQLKKLLKGCTPEEFAPEAFVCKAGAESDSMYVLLSGTIEIRSESGTPLLTQQPITTIGEAGMLTGEKRTASVVARTPVKVLTIKRRYLMQLMQDDLSLASRLYRNVMFMVREKLMAANQRIGELLKDQEKAPVEPSL